MRSCFISWLSTSTTDTGVLHGIIWLIECSAFQQWSLRDLRNSVANPQDLTLFGWVWGGGSWRRFLTQGRRVGHRVDRSKRKSRAGAIFVVDYLFALCYSWDGMMIVRTVGPPSLRPVILVVLLEYSYTGRQIRCPIILVRQDRISMIVIPRNIQSPRWITMR